MFWDDIRAQPKVEINCALVKHIIENFQGIHSETEVEDHVVEMLTSKIERYIAQKLNSTEKVSLYEAFIHFYDSTD